MSFQNQKPIAPTTRHHSATHALSRKRRTSKNKRAEKHVKRINKKQN
jgi:hypothetical protein